MTKHKQDQKNPKDQKKTSKKYMPDGTEEPSKEANYDPNDPDKKIEIDDNPDETKRKIPNL